MIMAMITRIIVLMIWIFSNERDLLGGSPVAFLICIILVLNRAELQLKTPTL